MQTEFTFHVDAGHGWVAVPVAMLEQLNLLDKISQFSYLRGRTAYLEEDEDAGRFLRAMDATGAKPTVNAGKYRERSRVRGYAPYSAAAAREIIAKQRGC